MNNVLFRNVMAVAMIALFAGAVQVPLAHASAVYNFTARGIVTDFDDSAKTVNVDVTKVDGKGKSDLETNNTEFNVGKAKTVKLVNNKDKRVTFHNLAIGQEISFKGTKYDDDSYALSFIRIHDRTFSVVGLLQEFSRSAKTMKISVVSSTYRPTQYHKGIEVSMTYNDDTKFKNGKVDIIDTDVNGDAQKVKVTGVIKDTNTWQVNVLSDKYKGK